MPTGLLHKVRALLSKAESTQFEAEADAFTAKAQELMARYRIDRALLDSASPEHCAGPVARRIRLPDPYADTKAVLLAVVAEVNGCHAVWSKAEGLATVFGFADELDGVEELFTSLLVQSHAAMHREGPKRDEWGRSRTTRFRRSFLVAFAVRIGERLREVVDATMNSSRAEKGMALVPILAAREEAVRAAASDAFPYTRSVSTRVSDGEGWYLGRVCGDQADLARGPRLDRRSA